ncbi:MAG: hypothetical protein ASARMPREDX12_007659 [Alectoria sarmentosa]|nr:MAG: hypothetical protein ASARMPREDX12_007659 [Alectoria sarmentosa]
MMAGGTRAARTKYLGLIGEFLEDVFAGDTGEETPVKTMEMLIQNLVVIVRRGQEKKGKGKRWKQAEDAQKPAAPAFENHARKIYVQKTKLGQDKKEGKEASGTRSQTQRDVHMLTGVATEVLQTPSNEGSEDEDSSDDEENDEDEAESEDILQRDPGSDKKGKATTTVEIENRNSKGIATQEVGEQSTQGGTENAPGIVTTPQQFGVQLQAATQKVDSGSRKTS